MNSIHEIQLDHILPNPYQTRESEDPEHVAKIAASIEAEGLLQVPVGRWVFPEGRPVTGMGSGDLTGHGMRVQLAFGHTRLAAFLMLANRAPGGGVNSAWGRMPVAIRELTDEEMFRLAVSENLARKDLSPIEEAKAMLVYRDQFKKTSQQIGQLFGLSDSAVRNKLRLLNLPETVQAAMEKGDLPEAAARRVLSLQAIAPEKVEEVTATLTGGGYETPEKIASVVATAIVADRSRFCMWDRWKTGEARGGTGLWKLSDEVKRPEEYYWISDNGKTWEPWMDALGKSPSNFTGWQDVLSKIGTWLESGNQPDAIVDYFKVPLLLVHQVQALSELPACTKCPLYVKMDGSHYCGLKACWERKRKAFYQMELERVSKELGIAIYDKKTDGVEKLRAGETYYDPEAKSSYSTLKLPWDEWFEKRIHHLRVMVHYNDYQPNQYTKNACVALISVGPTAKSYYDAQLHKKETEAEREADQSRRRQMERKNRDQVQKFIVQAAVPVFAQALEPLESVGLLLWLVTREYELPETRKEQLAALRQIWMGELLEGSRVDWRVREQGPVATAQYLEGVAKQIGVTLPEDWLERAKSFEVDAGDPQE